MVRHFSIQTRTIDAVSCLGALVIGLLPVQARATPENCEGAAEVAATEFGVPVDLLRAVTLAETGRLQDGALRPWPWAVNQAGHGQWFDTRQAAETYVRIAVETGARNIDVGCFQLNYRWHAAAFTSVSEMFDPLRNARYAASFLLKLYQELGDWRLAAGAYHSRTPDRAERYSARVETLRLGLPDMAPPLVRPTATNRFPLLQSGALGAAGSLVPGMTGTGPILARAAAPLIGS